MDENSRITFWERVVQNHNFFFRSCIPSLPCLPVKTLHDVSVSGPPPPAPPPSLPIIIPFSHTFFLSLCLSLTFSHPLSILMCVGLVCLCLPGVLSCCGASFICLFVWLVGFVCSSASLSPSSFCSCCCFVLRRSRSCVCVSLP